MVDKDDKIGMTGPGLSSMHLASSWRIYTGTTPAHNPGCLFPRQAERSPIEYHKLDCRMRARNVDLGANSRTAKWFSGMVEKRHVRPNERARMLYISLVDMTRRKAQCSYLGDKIDRDIIVASCRDAFIYKLFITGAVQNSKQQI